MARRRPGLIWQRTSDALRAFVSRYGTSAPRRALLCTYDIDVSRFEAMLLPELMRRGRQFRTLVLADAGALQTHLLEAGTRLFARYQIAPVQCAAGGVFHPKILLIKAGKNYLVGIGPANLTAGGLGGNLELMLFADHNTLHGRELASGLAAFFDAFLMTPNLTQSHHVREFVQLTLAGIRRDQGSVIHSLNNALLPQMAIMSRSAGIGKVSKVLLLSPWYSSAETNPGTESTVLQKIRHALGGNIILYTEGRNGQGPGVGKNVKVNIRVEQRSVDDGTDDAAFDRRPTRVHAKAYLVRGQKGRLLFFGSANCTHAALTRAAGRGGNVEVLLASRLTDLDDDVFDSDLADLFASAIRWFTPESPRERKPGAGAVLCGHLLETRSGPYLEVEAPSLTSGKVFIAPNRRSQVVPMAIRGGIGEERQAEVIRRLFPDDPPTRRRNSWGSVLWERAGRVWCPFPVFVPLVGSFADGADTALEELLWEEAGWWPPEDGKLSSDAEALTEDDAPFEDEDDGDQETLTEARHQGILDRLAVTLSIFRRRICARHVPREYAEERLDLLRRQVTRETSSHIRRVLLEFLQRPGPQGTP